MFNESSNTIHYLSHPSGMTIFHFTVSGERWVSAKEMAILLGYRNNRSAVLRHVSEKNKKVFEEFDPKKFFSLSTFKLQKNRIFINLQGLSELVKSAKENSLNSFFPKDWGTEDDLIKFFSEGTTTISNEALGVMENKKIYSTVGIKQSLEQLGEISDLPCGIKQSLDGYVYLLRLKDLGKVEKTRSIKNLQQSFLQGFKDGEIIWFCSCDNIDLLEREILEKLAQLGAFAKTQESGKLFDPTITSFDQVQGELKRLADRINLQYHREEDRILLKKEYTKLTSSLVALANLLSKEYPKESISLLEQVFLSFRELERKSF